MPVEKNLLVDLAGVIFGVGIIVTAKLRASAIEKRMAQGDDAYLEEQRTYRAYPGLRNPRTYRLWGVAIIVLVLLHLVLTYYADR